MHRVDTMESWVEGLDYAAEEVTPSELRAWIALQPRDILTRPNGLVELVIQTVNANVVKTAARQRRGVDVSPKEEKTPADEDEIDPMDNDAAETSTWGIGDLFG